MPRIIPTVSAGFAAFAIFAARSFLACSGQIRLAVKRDGLKVQTRDGYYMQ
jgi:hypothetical protein